MDDIVVLGGGGHAKVLISLLKRMQGYNLLGYTDICDKGDILGIKYLGNDAVLESQKSGKQRLAAIGIGNVTISSFRQELCLKIKSKGYRFPPIISDRASVSPDVELGEGAVVFDGAIINAGSKLGVFSIANTGCIIEHDCTIGDFVHIAPGATLCGCVEIGNNTMIGAGAIIIQNITVASNSLIGAGSLVLTHCLEPGTYIGSPVKQLKK